MAASTANHVFIPPTMKQSTLAVKQAKPAGTSQLMKLDFSLSPLTLPFTASHSIASQLRPRESSKHQVLVLILVKRSPLSANHSILIAIVPLSPEPVNRFLYSCCFLVTHHHHSLASPLLILRT